MICKELEKQHLSDYSIELIRQAITEATGVSTKIGTAPLREPEIQVQISRDRSEASVLLHKPDNCRSVALEEVLEKVKSAGVVYGIDKAILNNAMQTPDVWFVFAKGKPSIPGENASILLKFEPDKKGKPEELVNGQVDYKNLNMFTVVNEGDLLAEKVIATKGQPGSDVLGKELLPKPGKDIPLPIGKNTHSLDGLSLVASIAGQVVYSNRKISVEAVIEVQGDVDLSTGNIEFIGGVKVNGSVQQGFFVKAQGNIEIDGSVNGGVVEGRSVVIKQGINGQSSGYLKASENVVAKFIENATITAGVDVIVSDVILHSNVNAGKRVVVQGKHGLIAGGKVVAGEEIFARTIGTEFCPSTDLEVGVNPVLREEYQTLRKEIKQHEYSLQQTKQALSILQRVDQTKITPERREMLIKFTKTQFNLIGRLEITKKRMVEIETVFEELKGGQIKVAEVIYPGVRIAVGTLVKPIREPHKYVTFKAEDGEIKIGSFR